MPWRVRAVGRGKRTARVSEVWIKEDGKADERSGSPRFISWFPAHYICLSSPVSRAMRNGVLPAALESENFAVMTSLFCDDRSVLAASITV